VADDGVGGGSGGAIYSLIEGFSSNHYITNSNFTGNVAGSGMGNDITDASIYAYVYYNKSTFNNITSTSDPIKLYGSVKNVSLDCVFTDVCHMDSIFVSSEGEDTSFCYNEDMPCRSLV
jgi:hypothetical protein